MKHSSFVIVALAMTTPPTYASSVEMPWGNFLPALIIVPIIIAWMIFDSIVAAWKNSRKKQDDPAEKEEQK